MNFECDVCSSACGISVRYLRGSSYSDDVDEYRLFARDVMYLSYPRRISRNCSPEEISRLYSRQPLGAILLSFVPSCQFILLKNRAG